MDVSDQSKTRAKDLVKEYYLVVPIGRWIRKNFDEIHWHLKKDGDNHVLTCDERGDFALCKNGLKGDPDYYFYINNKKYREGWNVASLWESIHEKFFSSIQEDTNSANSDINSGADKIQEIKFEEYVIPVEEYSKYRCVILDGNKASELIISPRIKFVDLPLKPRHCEKMHRLCRTTIHYGNRYVFGYYCRDCKKMLVDKGDGKEYTHTFRRDRYEINVDLQKHDERWFAAYCKYCSTQFLTLKEYQEFQRKRFEKLRMEDKERQREEEEKRLRRRALLQAEKDGRQMQKAIKERNGDPLGNLPKQRKRGFWS